MSAPDPIQKHLASFKAGLLTRHDTVLEADERKGVVTIDKASVAMSASSRKVAVAIGPPPASSKTLTLDELALLHLCRRVTGLSTFVGRSEQEPLHMRLSG